MDALPRGSLKKNQFIASHHCFPLYKSADCSLLPPADSILHFLKRPSRKPPPLENEDDDDEDDDEPALLPKAAEEVMGTEELRSCALFCCWRFFSSSRAEIVSEMRFENSG